MSAYYTIQHIFEWKYFTAKFKDFSPNMSEMDFLEVINGLHDKNAYWISQNDQTSELILNNITITNRNNIGNESDKNDEGTITESSEDNGSENSDV